MNKTLLCLSLGLVCNLLPSVTPSGCALPPPEDIPEEVLRTEIVTEARSPWNGEPLTAAEYTELRSQLEEPGFAPAVSPKLRQLIFLLRIRKTINTLSPIPLL